MSKIVLASNNSHKIKEFERILDGWSVDMISQSSLSIPEAAETGLTFIENAILKARNACFVSGLPAIADDSGIEVDALSGRPGIYSARYAGEKCDDEENNSLLLKELKNIPFKKRTARYHCTIAFLPSHDCPVPNIYNASWEGYINEGRAGKNGFGYDALFYLPDLKCTAAELSESKKNVISHRGKALELFKLDFMEIMRNL
jgi:XTP/dITP diphosphohydrolase